MTIERGGRFTDPGRGSGLIGGLQDSTALPDTFTAKDAKRNLKPFKKYGMSTNIKSYAKKTDTQIENMAANAIVRKAIKKGSIKRVKPRTGINYKKYGKKKIAWAKRVMAADNPRAKALRKTRQARRHIRTIRQNREALKKPLFSKNV